MRPRFGAFAGLSSMVGGRRLCQMLCFTMGYMLICVVRVSAVVRKSRFFPSPPLELLCTVQEEGERTEEVFSYFERLTRIALKSDD